MCKKLMMVLLVCFVSVVSYAQIEFQSTENEDYVKLMFVGDIKMDKALLNKSYNPEKETYEFQNFFYLIRPILNLGHVVVGNIKSIPGTPPYGNYPLYKSPGSFSTSMKYCGFNVLATANNRSTHARMPDWSFQKKALDKNAIEVLGTYASHEKRAETYPLIIEKKGIKIAMLNYMCGIEYYNDINPVINGIDRDMIEADIHKAKEKGAEFIAVYFNWGREGEPFANFSQQAMARLCHEAGADIVVGTNPDVVQQAEYKDYEVDGETNTGLTVYSLGNFTTNSNGRYNNAGAILEVIIKKDKKEKKVTMHDFGFIPIWGYHYKTADSLQRYTLIPVSQVEQGNIKVNMSYKKRSEMIRAANDTRMMLGVTMNEVEYKVTDEIIEEFNEVLLVTKRPINDKESGTFDFEGIPGMEDTGIEQIETLAILDLMAEVDENDVSKVEVAVDQTLYKIQFLSLPTKAEIDTRYYTQLKDYNVVYEKGEYRYLIGESTSKREMDNMCLDIRRMGHNNAKVVAYKNGIRIEEEK